jgi:hypothetical protein
MWIHKKEFNNEQARNTWQSQEIDKDNAFQIPTGFLTLCSQILTWILTLRLQWHIFWSYVTMCLFLKQDWHTSVQKNLYQFVLFHVRNSINLCQYGEDFLLVTHVGVVMA